MSYNRISIKANSWKALSQNWINSLFLIMLTFIAQMLGLNFFPFFSQKTQTALLNVLNQSASALDRAQPDNMFHSLVRDTFLRMWNILFPHLPSVNQILLLIISILLLLLMCAPLNIGLCRFFQQVSQGQKPPVWIALQDYSSIRTVLTCVGFQVTLFALYAIWFLLIFAVPSVTFYAALHFNSMFLFSLGILFYLAAAVLYFIKICAYLPAAFLLAENVGGGALTALRESIRITRGKLLQCAVYRISFLVWQIFSSFLLFIYFIYEPFYLTSTATFTNELRTNCDLE